MAESITFITEHVQLHFKKLPITTRLDGLFNMPAIIRLLLLDTFEVVGNAKLVLVKCICLLTEMNFKLSYI